MTILDIGAYASAMIAVITLVSKLAKLISHIQLLVNSIKSIQETVQDHTHTLGHLHERLDKTERELTDLTFTLQSAKQKESDYYVFK